MQPAGSTTVEQLITPTLAKEYLAKSKVNRNISQRVVRQYADDMAQGRWRITNQGIGFDVDDILIDGHHRLNAVIISGCSVLMNVTLGLPRGAGAVIDIGYKREPGHLLWMLYQVPNAAHIAAIGKAYLFCDEKISTMAKRVEPVEIFTAYSNNKEAFNLGKEVYKVGSAAMAGALAYIYKIDAEKTRDFVAKVTTKVGIEADSPEQAFLQWIESTSKRGSAGGMVRQKEVVLAVASVMVHKLKGTNVKIVRPAEGSLEIIRKLRKDVK